MNRHANNSTGFRPTAWTLAAALLLASAPEGVAARSVNCIATRNIRSMEMADAQTARVTLMDRTVYLNKFRSPCSVSGFNGFKYGSSGQLCRGHTVRAVGTGNSSVCILGRFEQVQQPPG